jgi:6-phosphogluconate dehydrogenase
LNIERNRAYVVGYDRSAAVRSEFASDPADGKQIKVAESIDDFIDALARPRHILLMIPSPRCAAECGGNSGIVKLFRQLSQWSVTG